MNVREEFKERAKRHLPFLKKMVILTIPLFILFVLYSYIVPIYQDYADKKKLSMYAEEGKKGEFGILSSYWAHKPFDGTPNSRSEITAKPYLEDGVAKKKIKGKVYFHPVLATRYALQNWEMWLNTSEHKYYSAFIKQADALAKTQVVEGDVGLWYYHFDWYPTASKAPWYSGMAQSQAMSVLLRAWQVTDKKEYLEVAKLSLNSFEKIVDEGGVVLKKGDLSYYEEYPTKIIGSKKVSKSRTRTAPSKHTLNGFIYTLFGLHDYYLVTKDKGAKDLFDKGIKTLIKDLESYDLGFYSSYDQTVFKPSDIKFRLVHKDNPVIIKGVYLEFNNEDTPFNLFSDDQSICKQDDNWSTLKKGFGKETQEKSTFICKTMPKEITIDSDSNEYDFFVVLASKNLARLTGEEDSNGQLNYKINSNLLARRVCYRYHLLHTMQLNNLFNLTNVQYFKNVAEKWTEYREQGAEGIEILQDGKKSLC